MSEFHCRICALPLERKGAAWVCTATASHDYHRPLTLTEEIADLRAAAIIRAEKAERDAATWRTECESISAELGLPPGIRPVDGELRNALERSGRLAKAEDERKRAATEGYLSAVSTMLRIDHDYQTAGRVLQAGGLREVDVKGAGLVEADTAMLVRALGYLRGEDGR